MIDGRAAGGKRRRHFAALLQEARKGEAFALGQLLNAYRPILLALAEQELEPELRKKGNPSDIVQETFVEAQRDFAQFTSGKESEFRAWLTRLLENNLHDFRRHFKARAKRDLSRECPLSSLGAQAYLESLAAKTSESPSKELVREEDTELLQAMLNRLRPEYRQVILWHNRDSLTFKEIAERVNRSEDAVRMLWKRAIARLTCELQGSEARSVDNSSTRNDEGRID